MKKRLLIMMGIVLTAMADAQSQSNSSDKLSYISLGPVMGYGGSWVGYTNGNRQFQPSLNIGIGLIYSKSVHWGLGTQLVVASEGYSTKDINGYTASVTPVYLRAPLRAYYFFGDYNDAIRPKIYLGPSLALKISEPSAFSSYGDTYNPFGNYFRTFDLGLDAGVGINFKLAKSVWLNTDLGYYHGVIDAVKYPADDFNANQHLGVNAGLLIGL